MKVLRKRWTTHQRPLFLGTLTRKPVVLSAYARGANAKRKGEYTTPSHAPFSLDPDWAAWLILVEAALQIIFQLE
jgi:hypothetical protein